MKPRIFLLAIILVALITRVWGQDVAPVSPNWDEASLGYNTYSILKTGKDEWGNFLPSIFPAFGDYKLPVYIYASLPSVAVFGLNTFSVRLASSLAGVLAVYGIYLLTNIVFSLAKLKFSYKGFGAGHFAALILSLLPWHIFLSRPALEANLALTLYLFGLYFLLTSLSKNIHLVSASILLGLAMHTYNSYRILVPLTAITFLFFYFKKINFKSISFAVSFTVSLLASALVINQINTGQGLARYEKLKILNTNTIYQIGEARQLSLLPQPLPKLVHNRPVFFATAVIKNYLSYFSPQFWNQSKGAQYQFAIPGQNLATYPVLILSILGVVYVLASKSKELYFLLSLLFLSPLAASLTNDPPQAIRPSPLIIFVCLFFTIGFFALESRLKKHQEFILCAVIALFTLSSVLYLKEYWSDYQFTYSSSWQYGYKQVFDYLNLHTQPIQNIFITKKYGEPHIFHFFYNQVDPKTLHESSNVIRFSKSDWLWTDRVGNFHFVNDWQISESNVNELVLESGHKIPTSGAILVTSPTRIPTNSIPLKVINFLDGQPAFIIVSIP